jgi:predicted O-linked N-acetylglucosamine transferase (SPINDLY family)
VLTFATAKDMSGRVGNSIMKTLGLHEMIAPDDEAYRATAIALASNKTFFNDIRHRLVQSCLQTQPRHRFWDLDRYVRNLERGFEEMWFKYLSGAATAHIAVKDEMDLMAET